MMGRAKEGLTIIKVLWVVWVWEPVLVGVGRFRHSWGVHFGLRSCCGSPDLRVTGDPKYTTVQECLNCGHARTFSASWYLFP